MRSLRTTLAIMPLALGLMNARSATAQTPSFPSRSASPPTNTIDAGVADASRRFSVPARWIRAVMHVESDGDASATSRAGAIGLMQVMPETYSALRGPLGLGTNPYDPHDNIAAGTAYLREMFDRYGTEGFLAAYNAGPSRWEDYLATTRPLPAETIRYMAGIIPMLNAETVDTRTIGIATAVTVPKRASIFVDKSAFLLISGVHPVGIFETHFAVPRALSRMSVGEQFAASGASTQRGPELTASARAATSRLSPAGEWSAFDAPVDRQSSTLFLRFARDRRQS